VTCLSALLLAHSRLGMPSPHQQALLLQASAQLASLPCVRALSSVIDEDPDPPSLTAWSLRYHNHIPDAMCLGLISVHGRAVAATCQTQQKL